MSVELAESLKNLKAGQHLCSFYENEEEQFSVVIPFIKYGLNNSERCVYITDDNSERDVKLLLKRSGIDIRKHKESGQLIITTAKDVGLKSGELSNDEVFYSLRKYIDTFPGGKYRTTRIANEMTWILNGELLMRKLGDCETKIGNAILGSQTILLCQYNKRKFQEKCLLDAFLTHPLLASGDHAYDNFYCMLTSEEALEKNMEIADVIDAYIENVRNKLKVPPVFESYMKMEEKDREIVDKLLRVVFEMDKTTQEAFAELFGKKRYGCFSLIFKAGECIGFDWKSSHRK